MCNVQIGGEAYCSQCNAGAEHLVDGKCVAAGGDTGCTPQDAPNGTCKSCRDGYFMYQGGCYSIDASKPGHTLCTTAPAGVCTAAAAGYFIPPGATKTDQSVVACGDATTGVTVDTNKKYVGVDGCSKCSAPQTIQEPNGGTAAATCSECTAPKIVKTDKDKTTCIAEADCPTTNGYFLESGSPKNCKACAANCLTCTSATETACQSCTANTYFLGAADGSQGKCVSCGDATGSDGWTGVTGCAKCTKPNTAGPATCTECTSNYLKIEGKTTSCVDANACTGGFFPTTDSKNKKVCVSCSETSNGGIEHCSTCTPIESPTTTVLVMCSACESNKKVSPGGSSCATDCPENSTGNENACICNSGFAPNGDSYVASSSINLSTGAIAGISVAVIAVVGGLVGFLCWWFICHGSNTQCDIAA